MSFRLADLKCTSCSAVFVDVLYDKSAVPVPEAEHMTQQCRRLDRHEGAEPCGPFVELISTPGQKKHSSWLVEPPSKGSE